LPYAPRFLELALERQVAAGDANALLAATVRRYVEGATRIERWLEALDAASHEGVRTGALKKEMLGKFGADPAALAAGMDWSLAHGATFALVALSEALLAATAGHPPESPSVAKALKIAARFARPRSRKRRALRPRTAERARKPRTDPTRHPPRDPTPDLRNEPTPIQAELFGEP
jgi:hypothetical protein